MAAFVGELLGLRGKGSIAIIVDKPHYISGEVVSGSLQVDVLEPIECNEVVVVISGKEKVHWSETHDVGSGDDRRSVTRTFSSSHRFLNQAIVLYSAQHHISPGQYIYPFQYQLPIGLPGTFDNQCHDGVDARVQYSIKGRLRVDGFFSRDVKRRQTFIVYAQLAGYVAPSVAEKTQVVRFLCCFRQGTCYLRVGMDKNMYTPGDVPMILCDIRNESAKDVRRMRCELVRIVDVMADRKHRTLQKTICGATFPGVAAGAQLSQPQPFQLLSHGEALYPSTRGNLVGCRYEIRVTCDIAWCPDVTLELPIALGGPFLLRVDPFVAA
ncbi:hypothetical protein SPRG_06569 [Saprolegnia parasitica CBS 223.65]|uniref:Arrestin C-terminal-like domain-containing protein n=1 Tax=Saprolegnia parasitica (strain CBS 223.65) TaxID=695850 RepID=A0A067CGM8_SAPPC|nr:hypothetical protein SPRG_06569 [Saprolegnia parasitica CBS 223.65]KDO28330.1 hypothetical protein SPRG_06569 [Saprolegnia parasitica CBS 223.65]|eukprot:XP_012200779.1 hypothetical protein SPRG_06569 [Saprolegnia parasitica CBS 223.65]